MQRYEAGLAEHGRVLSDEPGAGGNWGYYFERTYGGVHSGRLRGTATILAFNTLLAAFAALAALVEGRWFSALCSAVFALFLLFFLRATALTLRRRAQSKRRGIRLLGPPEPTQG